MKPSFYDQFIPAPPHSDNDFIQLFFFNYQGFLDKLTSPTTSVAEHNRMLKIILNKILFYIFLFFFVLNIFISPNKIIAVKLIWAAIPFWALLNIYFFIQKDKYSQTISFMFFIFMLAETLNGLSLSIKLSNDNNFYFPWIFKIFISIIFFLPSYNMDELTKEIYLLIAILFFFIISSLLTIDEFYFGLLGFIIIKQTLNTNPHFFIYFRVKYFFTNISLEKNPYLENPYLKVAYIGYSKLINQSYENPEFALEFANFLFKHRTLQRDLAYRITHAARISLWHTFSLIRSDELIFNVLLQSDETKKSHKKYIPSLAWYGHLTSFKQKLLDYEEARQYKKEFLTACINACNALLERTNLNETFIGRNAYLQIFEHWLKQLDAEKENITQTERISINPYSNGVALNPNIAQNKGLFLDRDDLRDSLAQKILNSTAMPMLFLQGQRRVGKTSLLKFLPTLLGYRYLIVSQDFDTLAGSTIKQWLIRLRSTIQTQLKCDKDNWQPPANALEIWDEIAQYLVSISRKKGKYIIITFDEYEKLQTTIFNQDPTLAQNILLRMRGFLQSQDRVVMMFVGADSFSDLKNPEWAQVFVHRHVLRIDYLSQKASMQLIEKPVPEFGLKYENGVAHQIWELTQGHPHLLHTIGWHLVDYANQYNINPISAEDLEKILDAHVIIDNTPFDIFWKEFCADIKMRETVLKIIHKEKIDRNSSIIRLLDHGYILHINGAYKMRVPLFERWLHKYAALD